MGRWGPRRWVGEWVSECAHCDYGMGTAALVAMGMAGRDWEEMGVSE